MKTALCFTGTGRSLSHTYSNVRQNLIDPLVAENCDIFFLLAENPDAHAAEKYFSDIDQIKKLLIEEEEEPLNISSIKFRPGWPPPRTSPQIYIKMINARSRCNELVAQYERENNVKYERMIFSRLDVKYFNKVSSYINNLDYNCVYVPDFHNTFGGVIDGYNDRFAIGSRKNMDIYMRVPESIEQFNNEGGKITAETLLKWHLIKNSVLVKKSPIRFTRVRSCGTEIDLRLINQALQWGDT